MRKYAFLRENTVVKIEEITEEDYVQLVPQYQNIVDVQDLLVTPQAGWVLDGNKLIPGPSQTVSVKEMVKARIKLYQSRAPELLIDLYATNTLLGMTAAQSDASFTLNEDVIFVLCQGAFPTAIYRLQKKATDGLITQEVADAWIAIIQAAS